METCARGFSNTFMPESKLDVMDLQLQYIEGEELEHTWKVSRRLRVRQQEQKIWEDFVAEQDVVKSVCDDDPYQFIETLPEPCIQELMAPEKFKIRVEQQEEVEDICTGREGAPSASALVESDSGIFRIYDDDQDASEPEDEQVNEVVDELNDSQEQEPDTVRAASQTSLRPSSSKSSENVSNAIENSIYCAKIKDLRLKINEEFDLFIITLDNLHLTGLEAAALRRVARRARAFGARFQRVHLYLIHTQMADISRHNARASQFARHTHVQSQLLRLVSLHQNILHAVQVFHKSVEQTACVRECGEQLCALTAAVRAAADITTRANVTVLGADMVETCERVDDAAKQYTTKVARYLQAVDNSQSASTKSKKSTEKVQDKVKPKTKSNSSWNRNAKRIASKTETTGTKLSMYSLDVDNLRLRSRTSSVLTNKESGGTSKVRVAATGPGRCPPSPKLKKSPKLCRRPLMRGIGGVGAARRRAARDTEVRTMVEAVELPSTPVSPEGSLHLEARPIDKTVFATPRRSARSPHRPSPRPRKVEVRPISPKQMSMGTYRSDKLETIHSEAPLSPISRIQCLKRDDMTHKQEGDGATPRDKITGEQDKNRCTDKLESPIITPRSKRDKEKRVESNPANCEVTRLLRQLCGGDSVCNKPERSSAKNVQLLCVNGGSPRHPSTPQLLRILEETIQKKVPKSMYQKPKVKDAEKLRLNFNVSEKNAEKLSQYRTNFIQHMLSSPMYANNIIGKPWEMIGAVSEEIIDEVLRRCVKEMQLYEVVQKMYELETKGTSKI